MQIWFVRWNRVIGHVWEDVHPWKVFTCVRHRDIYLLWGRSNEASLWPLIERRKSFCWWQKWLMTHINYSGHREMIKGNWLCHLSLIIKKLAENQLVSGKNKNRANVHHSFESIQLYLEELSPTWCSGGSELWPTPPACMATPGS